ncbi:MAG: DUF4491 family protein [Bacteroidales bacterium]|nr:DUF4491 family protein [Bacteroidales bacterium]
MNFYGLIIGAATFLCIGAFHPLVIKAEYHWGVGCWWLFLLLGLGCIAGSLFVANDILSTLLGVVAFSSLWSILELFKQRKRVEKGWFPRNPHRDPMK